MHVDSLVRPIEVVSAADEALDMSHAARVEYAKTRDPALIRELPGERAVRFLCRPLTTNELMQVAKNPQPEFKASLSFMFGVAEIQDADENGPCVGKRLVPVREPGSDGRRMWQPEEMDSIVESFGLETIFEIGTFIYERALIRKKKGSQLRQGRRPFTVVQSLLDELAWIAPPLAEPHGATPEPTRST